MDWPISDETMDRFDSMFRNKADGIRLCEERGVHPVVLQRLQRAYHKVDAAACAVSSRLGAFFSPLSARLCNVFSRAKHKYDEAQKVRADAADNILRKACFQVHPGKCRFEDRGLLTRSKDLTGCVHKFLYQEVAEED